MGDFSDVKTFTSNDQLHRILPKILHKKRQLVFKNTSKSLASKVFDLGVLQSRQSRKLVMADDSYELKVILKQFKMKDLIALKTLRKVPDAGIVKAFQLLSYLKGEKAERWPEIQENIKPASFKIDLWKLSHKRIDSNRLQYLSKLLTNAETLDEKEGELYSLAVTLLQWIKWVLHKESVGKKVSRSECKAAHSSEPRSIQTLEQRRTPDIRVVTINGKSCFPTVTLAKTDSENRMVPSREQRAGAETSKERCVASVNGKGNCDLKKLLRVTRKNLSMTKEYNKIALSMMYKLSLIHICRCRRYAVCRSRWSPYH
eukprot:TRINITY_DN11673_c0_g1_i2.p1 TRINITY_DN11673_c0_g1~~TRINITY_DN11673_c0_g1_i2.p1  ORF type:complete len:315 (-),score=71.65 TRINITY_DN11673_c0_g1_i2:20-964(-)